MSPFDFPEHEKLTKCPHCNHAGGLLQYAFNGCDFSKVQAACLKCGAHGPMRCSYDEAAAAFVAGELEAA